MAGLNIVYKSLSIKKLTLNNDKIVSVTFFVYITNINLNTTTIKVALMKNIAIKTAVKV